MDLENEAAALGSVHSSKAAANVLSLESEKSLCPRLTARGSLSSRSPFTPELTFARSELELVYLSTFGDHEQYSSTMLTQADIKCAAVPKPHTSIKHQSLQTPVPNFSLPMLQPLKQPIKTRYYASALTPDDHIALALGEHNHNLKPWIPQDLILHEETRKDLAPHNVYIGPGTQVCIIPVITVTDGDDRQPYKEQSASAFRTSRCSSAPREVNKPLAREQSYCIAAPRTARQGSNFRTGSWSVSCRPPYRSMASARVRSPLINEVSNSQFRKEVTFDRILGSDCLGKSETEQEARVKPAGRMAV